MRQIRIQPLMPACLFLLLFLALQITAVSQDARSSTDIPHLRSDERGLVPTYLIQPHDTLEIFVYNEPNLTRKVVVRPDGKISSPLVQDIPAAGFTPDQLGQKIEERLKQYINGAVNVVVIVDTIQPAHVYVTGKVARPGAVPMDMDKPLNIMQALTLAGWIVDFGKTSEILIMRGSGEGSVYFRFKLSELVEGKNSAQNMELRSGDVVFVP